MSYAFIDEHQARWPVAWMCDALGVSTAGYYSWLLRDTSPGEKRREKLTVEIAAVHAEVKGRYGSPRIHAELAARGRAPARRCRRSPDARPTPPEARR